MTLTGGRRDRLDDLRRLLSSSVSHRIFPAAVAEIGDSRGAIWRQPFGRLTFDSDAAATRDDTIFDLASLTKPLVTTGLALDLIERQVLTLQTPIARLIAGWTGADRRGVTIADLLEHASGLAARLATPPPGTRREFEREICGMALESPPRTRAVYSDLGFILLGFALADIAGAPLDRQFAALGARLTPLEDASAPFIGFHVPVALREQVAPTRALDEDRRHGQRLQGDVHDNYASALGGVAGHAGLFGAAPAVGAWARLALRGARGLAAVPPPFDAATMRRATARSGVPGSSRALGWDTMLPTSSCGNRLSPSAFGHAGFTGTSLWIDPDRDRYFVLLTNRVCEGGTSDEMQAVRRAFHDAAADV